MPPFADSRRLTGPNLFFAEPGAVLEAGGTALDEMLISEWRSRTERVRQHLGWPPGLAVARFHAGGTSLALSAPVDQLFVATEINEWALCAALAEREPARTVALQSALVDAAESAGPPPLIEESPAVSRFEVLAALEQNLPLRELLRQAQILDLGHVLDESKLTLGAGIGGRSFEMDALPAASAVPWHELRNIPTAVVTGSNGKTTTVRLLAACTREHGWRTAFNCTDGVFLDAAALAGGDYSGPAGTRRVMRASQAQAAILEAARGGILRRGLAVSRVETAIVTNVSSDHFGEYGIYNLADLADVKLTVAHSVATGGLLVLNADDAVLAGRARTVIEQPGLRRVAWFALDDAHPTLAAHRDHGGATCGMVAPGAPTASQGVAPGHLRLSRGTSHDLGPVAGMPLSMQGLATYNIANLSGAALGALALGIDAATIAAVFARFGGRAQDNPGRMMRFDWRGAVVLIDYAHNPDGLHGLLHVAEHLRAPDGRMAVLLGHAGNRQNSDMEAVARTAALFKPQLIVIKENETQLRGRAPGEVPHIIRSALLQLGFAESMLPLCGSELEAVHHALDWARAGDVLALPLHGRGARAAVVALLESASA